MKFARVLLLALATSLGSVAGCATDDDPGIASDDLTDVSFEQLDVSKWGSPAGLTVLKSKQAYVDFFGEAPPQSVDFQRHWVVHVSMGIRNTGGYAIEITRIEKTGTGTNKTRSEER